MDFYYNGYMLKNVEIRAGLQRIYKRTFYTKLYESHNKLCWNYKGPAKDSENVTVPCQKPIQAKYCSVQYGSEDDKEGTIWLYEIEFRGKGNY